MTLEQLLPQLAPWVANLENVWPATFIKPQFAQWQVLHILSLVVLGGTTIILPYLEAMGDALACEEATVPPAQQAALLASVGIRLHG